MDPNTSIFGKEVRKRRVIPRNLGISTHIDLCRKYLEQHGTKDLASLLKGMEAWTRAMPTSSQCCHYLPLATLYVRTDSALCYSLVELAESLCIMHHSNIDGPIFADGLLIPIAARSLAGVMLKGFARFRDLAEESKFNTVARHAHPSERALLRQFADCINKDTIENTYGISKDTSQNKPAAIMDGRSTPTTIAPQTPTASLFSRSSSFVSHVSTPPSTGLTIRRTVDIAPELLQTSPISRRPQPQQLFLMNRCDAAANLEDIFMKLSGTHPPPSLVGGQCFTERHQNMTNKKQIKQQHNRTHTVTRS